MRTNIVLDDKLVEEGLKLTQARTKRELVDLALRELVAARRRKSALELEGRIEWEGDLKQLRRGRIDTG